MSDILNAAVTALNEKLADSDLSGTIKIEIDDEGSIMVADGGAAVGDGDAECTLGADAETFQGMLSGDVDPTSAFMSGKLRVDGDMGVAMQLGSALA